MGLAPVRCVAGALANRSLLPRPRCVPTLATSIEPIQTDEAQAPNAPLVASVTRRPPSGERGVRARILREEGRLAARGATEQHVGQGVGDRQAVLALEPEELADRVDLQEDVAAVGRD